MMKILSMLKYNFLRTMANKNHVILVLLMSFISILFAVYFTSKLEIKGNVAVVTHGDSLHMESKVIKFHKVDKEPSESELVMNKYDAVLIDKGNGKYEIRTIKGKTFKNMLEAVLKHPSSYKPPESEKRGVGTNILGYLVMFILLQGIMFMNLFSEDKDIRTLKRIATSPASIGRYLTAQSIFNFMMVYIPAFAVLVFCKEVLRIDIGFSYLWYILFLGIITLLSTAYALFVSAVVEKVDNVSTAGSSIIVLTSILAGSFFSFNNGNVVFKEFVNLLPQKNFMNLIQGIEQGNPFSRYLPQITYLLALSVVLFAAGMLICKKRFSQGRY